MAGTTRTTKTVYVDGIQLDQVEDYVYPGQRFTLIEKTGWQAFGRHNTIMKGSLPTSLKRKIFNQFTFSGMTFGADTSGY